MSKRIAGGCRLAWLVLVLLLLSLLGASSFGSAGVGARAGDVGAVLRLGLRVRSAVAVSPRPSATITGLAKSPVMAASRGVAAWIDERRCRISVWAGTGRPRMFRADCGTPDSEATYDGGIAVASGRVAWLRVVETNAFDYKVRVAGLATGRVGTIASAYVEGDDGTDIVAFGGGDELLAFSTTEDAGAPHLWLVPPSGGTRIACPSGDYDEENARAGSRVCVDGGPGLLLAVGAGRAAARAAQQVLVVDASGRRILTVALDRGEMPSAALTENSLVLLEKSTLRVIRLSDGRQRLISLDRTSDVKLFGARGSTAAIRLGARLALVDLQSGRIRRVALPEGRPPLSASLGPTGLYVTWNKTSGTYPGCVSFIPTAALP